MCVWSSPRAAEEAGKGGLLWELLPPSNTCRIGVLRGETNHIVHQFLREKQGVEVNITIFLS